MFSVGPAVLFKLLPKSVYEHFLLLHVAYRLLFMEKDLNIAQNLFECFVSRYTLVLGDTITYNTHLLLHVTDFVKKYGQPDSFSTYKYENEYQVFKKVCVCVCICVLRFQSFSCLC